jgi:hypothetical protein
MSVLAWGVGVASQKNGRPFRETNMDTTFKQASVIKDVFF